MKQDVFNQEILNRLLRSSNNGDMENEVGTRLIGHTPKIAPKAFTHVLFQPLNEHDLEDFNNKLGRTAPEQLKSFLSFANGMMIFSGSIRVLGFVPVHRDAEVTVHNYPSNIITPNVSARINGLDSDDVVIDWYKQDGSYAVAQETGTVTRYDVLGNGKEIQSWSDIDTWLIFEVTRLSEELADK
ncbi:MAG: SMI1/KNR4 family protein [Alteromonadaceae bacterium]|nr:SMI1/KNR4 family protein [Alteromonadaceae bacterium]